MAEYKGKNVKKAVKTGIVAGICGVGLCALAKRFKLPLRAAELAHTVDAVPFPGANLYAFLAARQFRTLYREIAEEIVASGHYEHILDIGTGAGSLPIEILALDHNAHVAGVDRSQDMVSIATANARAQRVKGDIEFSVSDPANLPYPGRYFDLVVSVNVLHHWADPAAVFEEVYHILKPGGEFWIYDYRREVPEEVFESAHCDLPFHMRMPFMFGPMASWRSAYSEEKLLAMARETHFDEPELELRTFTVCDKRLPVFNLLKLHKPEQMREEATSAP